MAKGGAKDEGRFGGYVVEEKFMERKLGRGAPDGRATEAGAIDETTAEEGKTGRLAPDGRATEAGALDETTAEVGKTGMLAPDGTTTEAGAIDETTAEKGEDRHVGTRRDSHGGRREAKARRKLGTKVLRCRRESWFVRA